MLRLRSACVSSRAPHRQPSRRSPRPQPDRSHVVRRRRLALAALVAVLAAVTAIFAGHGGSQGPGHARLAHAHSEPRPKPRARLAVGTLTLHLTERGRSTDTAYGTSTPRTLETIVRYPALHAGPEAPAARSSGPFPLIVFGHGFDTTPRLYRRLLDAWTRAGYVVAAPVFPAENANAAGGPTEADLPNEPGDFSFVIGALVKASRSSSGPLSRLVGSQVALAGQSDGGDAALAAAYDPALREKGIDAAAILSGAEIPQLGPFAFPTSGPPLFAVQGTADTVNLPSETYSYFEAAPRPKYLLKLYGAEHLEPYSTDAAQLALVTRFTLTFFDAYLKHEARALKTLAASAGSSSAWSLVAEP